MAWTLNTSHTLLHAAVARPGGGCAAGCARRLFLHPIQGNRCMPLILHELAAQHGLRIIGLDRPGVGESDPCRGRSVESYVQVRCCSQSCNTSARQWVCVCVCVHCLCVLCAFRA